MKRGLILAVALAAVTASSWAHGELPKLVKKEYIYKEIGDLEIKADVYRFADTEVRPVVVWFHGGALINGSRAKPHKDLYDLCERQGYMLISFDYRLAPEIKLPLILEDVKSAIKWIREQGPHLFRANPERIVVTGGSAGGYLALMTGAIVKPPVTAIVSFWGYGDVDGKWYTEPSKYYTLNARPVPKDKALKVVGKKVHTFTTWKGEARARNSYYVYLRQTGNWTKEVTGIDPGLYPRKLYPYSPVRNVKSMFPPTILIHGKKDEDVPYRKSVEMAAALKEAGITHELIGIDKGMHGLRGGDKEQIKEARDRIKKFIIEHITKE
jgi:acetyl esterase/lipase